MPLNARSAWPLTLAVAIVLADSSLVTLALPSILREFDAEVGQVAWVLIAYNAALALCAIPAGLLQRRSGRTGVLTAIGLVLFALASAACGLSTNLEMLVGARVVQAIGGALVVTGVLELLVRRAGSLPRGASWWAVAGVAGTAIGPMAGGVLTEALSWQSIFLLQVPLVLLALPILLRHAGVQAEPPTVPTYGSAGESQPARAAQPRKLDVDPPTLSYEAPTVAHQAATRPYETVTPPDEAVTLPYETVGAATDAPSARTRLGIDLALALLSAALTAALFLLVVLLIEGWRRTPILAAFTVTALPVAAISAQVLAGRIGLSIRAAAVSGAILISGGLAALAVLPGADVAWTIAPQLLVGVGIGLTIEPLTALSVGTGTGSPALLGGRNIAARHLGIVLGLALLTPIFTADLDAAQPRARAAVLELVIDAPLPIDAKLSLAGELEKVIATQGERIPDLRPAFDAAAIPPADGPAAERLLDSLDDQLDRAASDAFSRAFLIGALLALAALVPALLTGAGLSSRKPESSRFASRVNA